MRGTRLLLAVLMALSYRGFAQLPADTLRVADAAFMSRLARMGESLQAKHFAVSYLATQNISPKPQRFSESDIRKRLAELNSPIPMRYDPVVQEYVDFFGQSQALPFRVMLAYAPNYLPAIDEALKFYQLPQELRWLPATLSLMNPAALNGDGNTGLWQLNYGTAVRYGLTVNSFIDQRRDPRLASMAAARYLSELYTIYKDWELSLLAYSCGPAQVTKAIRRAAGNPSLSALHEHLPPEYRDILPAFTAVTFMTSHLKKMPPPLLLPHLDSVYCLRRIHFSYLDSLLGVPQKLTEELNPVYRQKIIPAGKDSFLLILPAKAAAQFRTLPDSAFLPLDSLFFVSSIRDPVNATQVFTHRPPPKGQGTLTHTVKAGENLSSIARRYGVTVKEIQTLNRLKGTQINVGQKLKIR